MSASPSKAWVRAHRKEAYEYLSDPIRFGQAHPRIRLAIKSVWNKYSTDNTVDLVGDQLYSNKKIRTYRWFQVYRKQLLRIYADLERRLGKAESVFKMEVPNWTKTASAPEEDYSALVSQVFAVLHDLNSVIASRSISPLLEISLHVQIYLNVYELAGKKLLSAYRSMTGNAHVNDIGIAIEYLRTHGYKTLVPRFNNKLRNGLAHGTWFVRPSQGGGAPSLATTDISFDSHGLPRFTHVKRTIPKLQLDTIGILFFVMASMSANANRYVDLIIESDKLTP